VCFKSDGRINDATTSNGECCAMLTIGVETPGLVKMGDMTTEEPPERDEEVDETEAATDEIAGLVTGGRGTVCKFKTKLAKNNKNEKDSENKMISTCGGRGDSGLRHQSFNTRAN
jgi:hypothetical protein